MPTMPTKGRSERLNVRLTKAQVTLIQLAAKETRTDVSSFLVESAYLRAEEILSSQIQILYSSEQWRAFLKMLDRIPQDKPRLKELLTSPTDQTSAK